MKTLDTYSQNGKHEISGPKSADDILSKDELNNAVSLAIKDLDADLKETVTLIYFQGMTYREAADFLDLSQKAVEKRMSKAYKILHKVLAPYI